MPFRLPFLLRYHALPRLLFCYFVLLPLRSFWNVAHTFSSRLRSDYTALRFVLRAARYACRLPALKIPTHVAVTAAVLHVLRFLRHCPFKRSAHAYRTTTTAPLPNAATPTHLRSHRYRSTLHTCDYCILHRMGTFTAIPAALIVTVTHLFCTPGYRTAHRYRVSGIVIPYLFSARSFLNCLLGAFHQITVRSLRYVPRLLLPTLRLHCRTPVPAGAPAFCSHRLFSPRFTAPGTSQRCGYLLRCVSLRAPPFSTFSLRVSRYYCAFCFISLPVHYSRSLYPTFYWCLNDSFFTRIPHHFHWITRHRYVAVICRVTPMVALSLAPVTVCTWSRSLLPLTRLH